jgi:hypothetical protein
MNRCPICTVKISDHKLMCWTHWDMVPEKERSRVLGLWNTALRGANASIRHQAMEAYRKARDAAIAAVKEQVTPK